MQLGKRSFGIGGGGRFGAAAEALRRVSHSISELRIAFDSTESSPRIEFYFIGKIYFKI